MSQSDKHRALVLETVRALENRYPQVSFVSDLQKTPGDPVPPIVDGFRPDVYSHTLSGNLTVIAEAKTDGDLDNNHTDNQILSFVNHLERKGGGLFILSVTGLRADFAKTFMRFILLGTEVTNTQIMVFDTLDFWRYITTNGNFQWHLS